MSAFENTLWRCQVALAALIELTVLTFLAIAYFEKHFRVRTCCVN